MISDSLADIAQELIGDGMSAARAGEAALIAPLLKDRLPPGQMTELLQTLRRYDLDRTDLLIARVRLAVGDEDKASLADLFPRLLEAERRDPQNVLLADLVGEAAFQLGEWATALDRLRAAGERRGVLDPWWRAGQAALWLGRDTEAEAAFWRTHPRLASSSFGPVAPALEKLLEAVNRVYVYADHTDHAALAAILTRSASCLRERLAESYPVTPEILVDAALKLRVVRIEQFSFFAVLPHRHGFIKNFDARYGTFDLAAFGVVGQGLLEHEEALLDHAAAALLSGRPPGGLRVARLLPSFLTDVMLELDRPMAARQRLEALRAVGLDTHGVARALERCALHEGKMEAVAAQWREATAHRPAASVHRTAYASEWHRLERLQAVTKWQEPDISGSIERTRPDGVVETFAHDIMPFGLDVTEVHGLELRENELIIGPAGTLLRPPNWHVRPGALPAELWAFPELCGQCGRPAAMPDR